MLTVRARRCVGGSGSGITKAITSMTGRRYCRFQLPSTKLSTTTTTTTTTPPTTTQQKSFSSSSSSSFSSSSPPLRTRFAIWFNQMSQSLRSHFLGVEENDHHPIRLMERQYLYFGLMALRLRELRYEMPDKPYSELKQLAVHQLETGEAPLDAHTNGQLRLEFQFHIEPQVQHIFATFGKVDEIILASSLQQPPPSTTDNNNQDNDVDVDEEVLPLHNLNVSYLKQLLQQEQAHVVNEMSKILQQQEQQQQQQHYDSSNQPQAACDDHSLTFLHTKHEALLTLLDYHGIAPLASVPLQVSKRMEVMKEKNPDIWNLDPFGMDLTIFVNSNENDDDDDDNNNNSNSNKANIDLIRKYQTLNLCRSALIRKQLGYSILCLRSTIAGRGVFVDGKARIGDLIAFWPGQVWCTEHLVNLTPDMRAYFQRNKNNNYEEDPQQMIVRADRQFLLDARQAPVTVLTQPGSLNPWALAHMVNHPNAGELPNCQPLMLNYLDQKHQQQKQKQQKVDEEKNEKAAKNYAKYIPNSYARPTTWRTNIFNTASGNEAIWMHGQCLLAKHDVSNQELVYDYRLQEKDAPHPHWYHHVVYGDEWIDTEGRCAVKQDIFDEINKQE